MLSRNTGERDTIAATLLLAVDLAQAQTISNPSFEQDAPFTVSPGYVSASEARRIPCVARGDDGADRGWDGAFASRILGGVHMGVKGGEELIANGCMSRVICEVMAFHGIAEEVKELDRRLVLIAHSRLVEPEFLAG